MYLCLVLYGSVNPSVLDDPDTISVVVGEYLPPSNIIWLLPLLGLGRVQQRWPYLSCLSVREGRGETSVPVIFSQDRPIDSIFVPPQMRSPQELWPNLSSCRFWREQELPLEGLYSSTLLRELRLRYPPDKMKPGTTYNCQTNMRLYRVTMILSLASWETTYFGLPLKKTKFNNIYSSLVAIIVRLWITP